MFRDTARADMNKLTVYAYPDSHLTKTYLNFVIKLGFAYRYVYFSGDPASQELNQGFTAIFCEYIRMLFSAEPDKQVRASAFRGASCISMVSEKEAVRENVNALYSALFCTKKNEEAFDTAKKQIICRFTKAYKSPYCKSAYHMLEFSDRSKCFSFGKFVHDMQNIDYATFCRYIADFIFPGNALLFLYGPGEIRQILDKSEFPDLHTECTSRRRFTMCAEKVDLFLQQNRHKVIPGTAPFRLKCMKFFFCNPDICLLDRYVLLNFTAGLLDGAKRDVNADAFDCSIIYHGDIPLPAKHKLCEVLSDENYVNVCKEKILAQLSFDANSYPSAFYEAWGNLFAEGIDLAAYISRVKSSTAKTLTELFWQSDIIVTEGEVAVKNNKLGEVENSNVQ